MKTNAQLDSSVWTSSNVARLHIWSRQWPFGTVCCSSLLQHIWRHPGQRCKVLSFHKQGKDNWQYTPNGPTGGILLFEDIVLFIEQTRKTICVTSTKVVQLSWSHKSRAGTHVGDGWRWFFFQFEAACPMYSKVAEVMIRCGWTKWVEVYGAVWMSSEMLDSAKTLDERHK
jgi:hypothetical protein